MCGKPTADQGIAWIASRQKGLVTWGELRAAGVTERQIAWRVRKGLLIPQHRGVYRVGHTAASTESMYLAAVKACGTGALLAGRAAAFHWRILRGRPPPPEVATATKREHDGIVTKRRRIDRCDAARYRGIPVLSLGAVLVDIAPDLSDDDLGRACHEASVKHGTLHAHVNAVLARRPRSPGAPKLRRVMSGETKVTLSELERRFLSLLREADPPLPEMNRVPAQCVSTAAGPSAGSPSSSTATAFTTRATRGSRTASASAKRAPGKTSSTASPGET
jgi:hypothetical protein